MLLVDMMAKTKAWLDANAMTYLGSSGNQLKA